ncbi:MAG: hypothetical protein JG718_01630 [Candidatus Thiothrix moscowensis]|nr:hypothetical protein [Candidatus Thiothrix moscowensis]
MIFSKSMFWLMGGVVAIWLALGCSSLPYANNSRPVSPPASSAAPEQPVASPASR